MGRRANYVLLNFGEHLGPSGDLLDVEWAEFVGDETSRLTFEVPTDDAGDAYLQLQAYDVGEYGHEVRVNDEPLSGFDLPPHNGWQSWMDALTGADLEEGENALRVRRDTATNDAFVIGAVTVHWTEPMSDVDHMA